MTTAIDASMIENAGGVISGVVTDAVTGKPIPNVTVVAEGHTHPAYATATTDSNGAYSIIDLSQGSYVVHFEGPADRYADQYYDNASSIDPYTAVDVMAFETTSGIDAAMVLAGTSPTTTPTATPSTTPTAPPRGGAGGKGDPLATTGSEVPIAAMVLGLTLTLAGVVLVRRRKVVS